MSLPRRLFALSLRLILLVVIALALAGLYWKEPVDDLAVVFVVVKLSQPSAAECSIQRLEYMTGDRAIYDVDDACRN